ncbi:MAG TPA: hypothetical protein VHW02_04325 [Rhizomicrobium sp.]|jgi:hypothetical protein|nr:hypothetical protein [Rhizomicrobium sp.]
MSDLQNDAIDHLLLQQFEGPVPDGGFCDQIMQRLPARRRRYTWPLVLGIVAGATMCGLSLLSAPLVRIGWRDWLAGELSAPVIMLLVTMAGISLLAAAWTAAEADDR